MFAVTRVRMRAGAHGELERKTMFVGIAAPRSNVMGGGHCTNPAL